MRKVMIPAVLAALVVLATGPVALSGAGPMARKAPEFVIESTSGKQTLLSSYRGKEVVLVFMFTDCPHCQKAAPMLARLQDEYGGKGVQFLGATFNKDAKANIDQFVRIFGVNFPCGFSNDENIHRFLDLPRDTPLFVPMLTFIDRNGIIRAQHMITGDKEKDKPETPFYNDLEVGIRGELDKMLKAGPSSARK